LLEVASKREGGGAAEEDHRQAAVTLQRAALPAPSAGSQPPLQLGDSPARLDLQRWAAAADERDAQRRLADENVERLQRLRLDAAVSAPPRLPPVDWAGSEEQQPMQPRPMQPQPSRALLPSAAAAGLARLCADPRWTPLPLRRPALCAAQTKEAAAQGIQPDAEFKRPEGSAAAPPPHQPPQSHRGATVPAGHDPLLRPPPDGEYKSSASQSETERREGEQPEAKRTKLTHPHAATAQPPSSAAAQPPPTAVRLQEHKEDVMASKTVGAHSACPSLLSARPLTVQPAAARC